jgi:hypothetical protein
MGSKNDDKLSPVRSYCAATCVPSAERASRSD